jgi:hypothetical protein
VWRGAPSAWLRHRGRPESPAAAALAQMMREDLSDVRI